MLSAAHVLAMDAKNLLDVVDSVRVRYPNLVFPQISSSSPTPQQYQQDPSSNFMPPTQHQQNFSTDCYQNFHPSSQMPHQHTSPPNSLNHSYDQQQQQQLYTNESVINQQTKKPVIAAKPPVSALGHKLKAAFPSQQPASNDNLLNEPLKIIEDPSEMYCNTSTASIKLPEPVSCTIVQENILASNSQKVMANKLG